ncbi:NAD-glutamate dehydrogenase [Aliivibrio wodanis]|uniref:NAD-glutamate dehydrogenase n=1 Tax=Aliivibrio wodanis TaxID=80852 RepID=UPI00406D264C
MTTRDPIVPVLLEKVYALIAEKLEIPQQSLVTQLAQRLFANIDADDLQQRNESDMYGATLSLWNHLSDVNFSDVSVRVFNPKLSQDGWQSTHTIVEIVAPDSPFLVDSVKMALTRLDMTSHFMLHGPHCFNRDESGEINSICSDGEMQQTLFHFEVDHLNDQVEMETLQSELLLVLEDIRRVVNEWKPMSHKLTEVIAELKENDSPIAKDAVNEAIEFLTWLQNHNFTLMGYKNFDLIAIEGDHKLTPTSEAGLGLFSLASRIHTIKLSDMPSSARAAAKKSDLLILTKSNTKSRIHRPAYTDYIGIKRLDKEGKVVGEHRFTGLYTSTAYNQSVSNIPLLSNKVQRTLESSQYIKGSHSYKALSNLFETYPRDELFQATEVEMLEVGMGVVKIQDRDLLRLFVRRDPFGRFFSCMVYVTKERYNTEFRRQTQRILKQFFNSDQEVEFTTFFSESALARTHYIVRVDNNNGDINVKEIENNLMEAASTWDDRLCDVIITNLGESEGTAIAKKYQRAFPRSYKEATLPGSAVADIERLELLSDDNKLGMLFYRPQEERKGSPNVKFKLFHRDEPIHLSDVMPMLENLGLRVIGESPYSVTKSDGSVDWILDFSMIHNGSNGPSEVDLRQAREPFQEAFAQVWSGQLESDGFNRLVLGAGLSGREVTILRAYARYMRQVGFPFSQQYIEDTLSAHPKLAVSVVRLFQLRFDPTADWSEKKQQKALDAIFSSLDKVESLDDDRIIRRYVDMIVATLRTNYYQKAEDGQPKPWLSLKLQPSNIPEIPAPVPAFEIFVYAPDIEGVHLRGGKVARGGLRWSDRQEDFRTEVLGLVKAQQVKNTVIVPVGAKGGFVCKKQHNFTTRDDIFAEGQRCYKQFIRALLDVSDNIIEGEVTPPQNVVRHDDDDPYLVVAADKGTATFSDLANSVSEEYNFWLGDAFASGGSNGYDHKAMGITAKGAWESVKRHFREMGIDCQTTDFTVAGVGDMAGDVFGNGMLLSKHIRLQAAFNHMHIFIDPNPNAEITWPERSRLFELPRSSWEDYNKDLISQGGGIFSRRAKSIDLSPEIQKMLGTRKQSLAPNDLIQMILKMDVDLMWNGGIGTYVKSEKETSVDVGDRANDALRINGSELNAKVVGEGGNLGMTQLGRIEYGLKGGRVNTDFVDNVGGVDCSDNEVNIKILLNGLVANGDLTYKQRNVLLQKMEDEVGEIVLDDAYCQSESISVAEQQGTSLVKEQIRFIHHLEKQGQLDRALEFIPDDETLIEREKRGQALTRPELSVLVAYGKMVLKEQLACDEIANNPYHADLLTTYFPTELQRNYKAEMDNHPLRSEIIATCLANQMVNEMGCNFITRLQEETGYAITDIANAYSATRAIFEFGDLFKEVRNLDNVATAEAQYEAFFAMRRTIRRVARWLLRNGSQHMSIDQLIAKYKPAVDDIKVNLDNYLVNEEVVEHIEQANHYLEMGVPCELGNVLARLSSLYSAMDISAVAEVTEQPVATSARLYYVLGDKLSLHWFLKQINNQGVDNHWQALARASFREDLDWQQRQLTTLVLSEFKNSDSAESAIAEWCEKNSSSVGRWDNILNEFKVGSVHEFAKFSVALRELTLLNISCTSN